MITKKVLLLFPKSETEKPIVYHLVKDYDLIVNIYRAKVTPEEYGYLVLDLTGEESSIKKGLEYVKSFHVEINEADRGIRWDSDKCTRCGNCLSHCPTSALYLSDIASRKVEYNEDKCIQCLSCIDNCPYGACSSIFLE